MGPEMTLSGFTGIPSPEQTAEVETIAGSTENLAARNIPDGSYDNTYSNYREEWHNGVIVNSLAKQVVEENKQFKPWGYFKNVPFNAPFDNNKQAVDIKGYRVLSVDEKERINALKNSEANILEQLDDHENCVDGINYRSTGIAREYIQTGFMWAIRAIARPNGE